MSGNSNSIPTAFLPELIDSTTAVPVPTVGSKTKSPGFVNF